MSEEVDRYLQSILTGTSQLADGRQLDDFVKELKEIDNHVWNIVDDTDDRKSQ